MATTYVVTGVDTGIPSLPNDSVIHGLHVGQTFTATLDSGVEAELIAAGLIAKSPVSSPVSAQADGSLTAADGRTLPVVTDSSATPKSIDSTGVANGNGLIYDSGSGKWKPGSGSSGGVTTFNTRSGAVVLSKADVTGTGLAAADVGADASGAAASEQTRALAAEALLAPKASPTFTGTMTAPEFSASGLTGATAASRYVGATASGAPTSGTFLKGDFVIDQTGKVWVCTVAGTSGTWVAVGGSTPTLSAALSPFVSPQITTGPVGPGANVVYAIRVVAGATGTLHEIAALINASTSHLRVGVYDTGQATSTVRTLLYDSGDLAPAGTNQWNLLGDAGIAVTAGQHYDLAVQPAGSCSFLANVLETATQSPLPTGLFPALNTIPKVAWTVSPGSYGLPATVSEASAAATTGHLALLARIA